VSTNWLVETGTDTDRLRLTE